MEKVLDACKVNVTYALSPNVEGKIERLYRWMQDRIVRICAREGIKTVEEEQEISGKEIERYNYYQVHSATKEIPIIRFERVTREKIFFA